MGWFSRLFTSEQTSCTCQKEIELIRGDHNLDVANLKSEINTLSDSVAANREAILTLRGESENADAILKESIGLTEQRLTSKVDTLDDEVTVAIGQLKTNVIDNKNRITEITSIVDGNVIRLQDHDDRLNKLETTLEPDGNDEEG